jgi:hypothetical protein
MKLRWGFGVGGGVDKTNYLFRNFNILLFMEQLSKENITRLFSFRTLNKLNQRLLCFPIEIYERFGELKIFNINQSNFNFLL